MAADSHDTEILVKAIENDLPDGWQARPGGRAGQIELALIEAVLTVRARGARAHAAVRASTMRWRAERNAAKPNDLQTLAVYSPVHLAAVLDNRQLLPGGLPMSWGIAQAARNLFHAGVRRAADLSTPSPAHRRAFMLVPGLGPATWAHFLMLLGVESARPSARTVRFVRAALGRSAPPSEARRLLADAAARLGVSPTTLGRALWTHLRSRTSALSPVPAP
jgi:hypothetical protein